MALFLISKDIFQEKRSPIVGRFRKRVSNFSVRRCFKRPFRSIFVYLFSKKALYIRWCINDENSFDNAYDTYAGLHDQDLTSSLHVRLQCQTRYKLFSHRISNNTRNRTRLCTLILRNLHRRHNGCALCFVRT